MLTGMSQLIFIRVCVGLLRNGVMTCITDLDRGMNKKGPVDLNPETFRQDVIARKSCSCARVMDDMFLVRFVAYYYVKVVCEYLVFEEQSVDSGCCFVIFQMLLVHKR